MPGVSPLDEGDLIYQHWLSHRHSVISSSVIACPHRVVCSEPRWLLSLTSNWSALALLLFQPLLRFFNQGGQGHA